MEEEQNGVHVVDVLRRLLSSLQTFGECFPDAELLVPTRNPLRHGDEKKRPPVAVAVVETRAVDCLKYLLLLIAAATPFLLVEARLMNLVNLSDEHAMMLAVAVAVLLVVASRLSN
jgi:hypothetical protein